ncbi:MAG: ribonuclease E inhibitor RraB [Woeseiaceae bacterium]|nr:ribonuclease E inhibitor RraB [Woeseiaceae bacterium]
MMRALLLVLVLGVSAACDSGRSDWDPDAAVIEQLRQEGSDLSKPHPIEFFLYFQSEAAAVSACTTLEGDGFTVSPQSSAATDDYLCTATKEVVPVLEEMHRLRAELESLASGLGGEYDGWGTPIVE